MDFSQFAVVGGIIGLAVGYFITWERKNRLKESLTIEELTSELTKKVLRKEAILDKEKLARWITGEIQDQVRKEFRK